MPRYEAGSVWKHAALATGLGLALGREADVRPRAPIRDSGALTKAQTEQDLIPTPEGMGELGRRLGNEQIRQMKYGRRRLPTAELFEQDVRNRVQSASVEDVQAAIEAVMDGVWAALYEYASGHPERARETCALAHQLGFASIDLALKLGSREQAIAIFHERTFSEAIGRRTVGQEALFQLGYAGIDQIDYLVDAPGEGLSPDINRELRKEILKLIKQLERDPDPFDPNRIMKLSHAYDVLSEASNRLGDRLLRGSSAP